MKHYIKPTAIVIVCLILGFFLGAWKSANATATPLAHTVEKNCEGVEVYTSVSSSPYIYINNRETLAEHTQVHCYSGQQQDLSIELKNPLRSVFRLCAPGVTDLISYSSEEDPARKKVNGAVGIENIYLDLDECRTVRSALVQLSLISISRIWINPVSQGTSTPLIPTIREVSCQDGNRSMQLVVAGKKYCYTGYGLSVALDLGGEYATTLCYYGTRGAALKAGGSENLSGILVYIKQAGCYDVKDLIESSGIQSRFLTIYPD